MCSCAPCSELDIDCLDPSNPTRQMQELHRLGLCEPCDWNRKPQGCARGRWCERCHFCPPGETYRRKAKRQWQLKYEVDCVTARWGQKSEPTPCPVTLGCTGSSYNGQASRTVRRMLTQMDEVLQEQLRQQQQLQQQQLAAMSSGVSKEMTVEVEQTVQSPPQPQVTQELLDQVSMIGQQASIRLQQEAAVVAQRLAQDAEVARQQQEAVRVAQRFAQELLIGNQEISAQVVAEERRRLDEEKRRLDVERRLAAVAQGRNQEAERISALGKKLLEEAREREKKLKDEVQKQQEQAQILRAVAAEADLEM
jgi:hypothetical protein